MAKVGYCYTFDGIGSTINLTDSSGNTVTSYSSDPYGNTTCTNGTSTCSSTYEPIRYAGGYYDKNTSTSETLYKFGQRYYNPTTSRWTQQDTLDNPLTLEGWNHYDYAGDDPINGVDPTGQSVVICTLTNPKTHKHPRGCPSAFSRGGGTNARLRRTRCP
jgi:RHS repeat-associated protein